MLNAYKRCEQLIKVKDEDSAITVLTEIGLSGCYQLNSILLQKVYEKYVYFIFIKSGSQYDASLVLRQLRCDKIQKTDWSNAT